MDPKTPTHPDTPFIYIYEEEMAGVFWALDGGERVENKMGGYSGQVESEGSGRSRNKRREKLYSFIKKTVVPYPRLG